MKWVEDSDEVIIDSIFFLKRKVSSFLSVRPNFLKCISSVC